MGKNRPSGPPCLCAVQRPGQGATGNSGGIPGSSGGQPIVARRIHADTPDENIFFAGEHLSILQSWQKGAILSAYHAIDLVVQRVTG